MKRKMNALDDHTSPVHPIIAVVLAIIAWSIWPAGVLGDPLASLTLLRLVAMLGSAALWALALIGFIQWLTYRR